MEDNLKELKKEYKDKKNLMDSQKAKKDYKEMKGLIKYADKILKDAEQDQKRWNKEWDKLDKKYKEFGETPSLNEVVKELDNNQKQFEEQRNHSEEVIKEADEIIKRIDEKLIELDKEKK